MKTLETSQLLKEWRKEKDASKAEELMRLIREEVASKVDLVD